VNTSREQSLCRDIVTDRVSMIRRFLTAFGSFLLVVAVIGVTILLVSYGRGYTYDFSQGRMIQTGLILVKSTPAGAQIAVNGKVIRQKAPYRGSYQAGDYTFDLTKTGYRVWHKVVRIVASQVTSAEYILMLPTDITKTILDTHPAIIGQTVSRDHSHLAYVTSGAEAAVYTLDLGSGKTVKAYSPLAATPTQPAEALSSVTWSDDASHLLVVSQIGPTLTHRVMTASGGDVVDLTTKFGFNFSGLQFSGTTWQQLYWISPGGLRRLDLGNQSTSAVLADQVSQFTISADRILYVQQTDLGRTLWSTDGRGRKQELIPALPDSDSYSIALTNYRGADELAVVPSKTGVGTLYSGIFGSTPVAKTVAHGVLTANFAPDGHLVVFSSPSSIQTYDLELSDHVNLPIIYTFAQDARVLTALSWFDSYHLLLNYNGTLVFSDYDGTNLNDLGPIAPTGPSYSSGDLKSIISVTAATGSSQITQSLVKP
jgi:hypothetical protein